MPRLYREGNSLLKIRKACLQTIYSWRYSTRCGCGHRSQTAGCALPPSVRAKGVARTNGGLLLKAKPSCWAQELPEQRQMHRHRTPHATCSTHGPYGSRRGRHDARGAVPWLWEKTCGPRGPPSVTVSAKAVGRLALPCVEQRTQTPAAPPAVVPMHALLHCRPVISLHCQVPAPAPGPPLRE
jgi:hypothetical protein